MLKIRLTNWSYESRFTIQQQWFWISTKARRALGDISVFDSSSFECEYHFGNITNKKGTIYVCFEQFDN